ncbi:MAG: holo-ACP synthase [Clostridia bacterium]|nr:holo-ACP synthase [Clostridia bacterium]
MLLGIGLDLCEIERIRRAIEKPRFLARVYTPAEQARILEASGPRRGEIAAGIFAAKEAVSKALGTGFDGFFADAIEILPDESGRPVCALSGGAKARADAICGAGRWRIWVSVTHESGMAAANAVLEGPG